MTSLDLHPEELIDLAAAGGLSSNDQARLDAHLAQCSVCRAELQLRRDFASAPVPALSVDNLVARALSGQSVAAPVRPRRRIGRGWAVAASLAAVSGFAAVGQLTGVLPAALEKVQALVGSAAPRKHGGATAHQRAAQLQPRERGESEAGTNDAPVLSGDGAPEVTAQVSEALAPPPTAEAALAAPASPEVVPSAPAPSHASTPRQLTRRQTSRELERDVVQRDRHVAEQETLVAERPLAESAVAAESGVAEETTPDIPRAVPTVVEQAPAPAAMAAPTPVPSPDELLAVASQARARGDRLSAVSAYRTLIARYPRAPQAQLSRATLGRLLLDTGDASGALRLFDEYVSGTAVGLEEEVLAARAVAYSRLFNPAAEAEAWSLLLQRYPQSIHVERARERLQQLAR